MLGKNIVNHHIKLSKTPNEESPFLTAWLMKLIESEQKLWRWRAANSRPPPASYEARNSLTADADIANADIVPIPVIGGELSLQSTMHNALIELANMFVAEEGNLNDDQWQGAIWNWAQRIGSGTTDFSNFQYIQKFSTMSTAFIGDVARAIFELKLGLTKDDLVKFIRDLREETLILRYSGNSITVVRPNGAPVHVGLGLRYILAQVSVFKLCSTGQSILI